ILAAIPSFVIDVLFGSSYLGAANTVRILGIEAAGLGMLSLLIYLHLARESLDSLFAWIGAAIAFIGIELFHGSIVSIAFVMLISVAFAASLSLAGAVHALLRDPLIEDVDFIEKHLFHPVDKDAKGLDLSIVVPYYNPGVALSKHISALVEVLDKSKLRYEIIAVSDGSTDGSPDTLTDLFPTVLRNTKLPKNSGKGQALRVGLMQGRGEFLGFIDADGDIPAMELMGIVEVIRASEPDIITGSKRHPNSMVYYPKLRRVYSWGYQQLIRTLFHLSVTDTQTGLKVLRREVVANVLPLMVEKRFAFDLEFFVVARRLGYREIIEVPVIIQRRFTSTISIKAVRGMLVDTLGIFYRLNVLHYYDKVRSQAATTNDTGSSAGVASPAPDVSHLPT
ncbi:glycosyltransferase, partial [bacterium]